MLGKKETYSEAELITLLKAKNQKAFSYLYDNYSKALFLVSYRILNDTEEAEDSLQNSFVKIWNSFDLYDSSKGKLYTWMLNITRNLAIDTARSKALRFKNKIQEVTEIVYHKNGLFVEDVKSDSIGLSMIVHDLTNDQKEIIELVYFQGYTQQEISEKLNMPLGSVKTKVRQALLILRKKALLK